MKRQTEGSRYTVGIVYKFEDLVMVMVMYVGVTLIKDRYYRRI